MAISPVLMRGHGHGGESEGIHGDHSRASNDVNSTSSNMLIVSQHMLVGEMLSGMEINLNQFLLESDDTPTCDALASHAKLSMKQSSAWDTDIDLFNTSQDGSQDELILACSDQSNEHWSSNHSAQGLTRPLVRPAYH